MFETVTVASPWGVPAARRSQLVGGALLLHMAAVAAYLAGTLWTIAPVSAPDLLEAFVAPVDPPTITFVEPARPPVAPARGDSAAATQNSAPIIESTVVQPQVVNTLGPAIEAENRFDGIAIGPAVAAGAGEAETGSARDGGGRSRVLEPGMVAPRILFRTDPKYPEIARKARQEGIVVIEAEIGRDGALRSARAVNAPLGFGLEAAALAALDSWRFTPATLHGKPISVFYRLTVRFSLH